MKWEKDLGPLRIMCGFHFGLYSFMNSARCAATSGHSADAPGVQRSAVRPARAGLCRLRCAFADHVRGAPLKERRAILASTVRHNGLQRCESVLGEGIAAFRAECDLDLEGVVAKRLDNPYGPRTKWWKTASIRKRNDARNCSNGD
jgi:hypothetical protein